MEPLKIARHPVQEVKSTGGVVRVTSAFTPQAYFEEAARKMREGKERQDQHSQLTPISPDVQAAIEKHLRDKGFSPNGVRHMVDRRPIWRRMVDFLRHK